MSDNYGASLGPLWSQYIHALTESVVKLTRPSVSNNWPGTFISQ